MYYRVKESLLKHIISYEAFSFPYFKMQNCFTNDVGMRVLPVLIRRNNFSSAKDSESGRGKNSG